MEKYILGEDQKPALCNDLMKWLEWFEDANESGSLRIAEDSVGDYRVSTIFLGINHQFKYGDRPILYETIVFDKEGNDVLQHRYSTREEALTGHQELIEVCIKTRDIIDTCKGNKECGDIATAPSVMTV